MPIRISPEVPIYISQDMDKIGNVKPTTAPIIANKRLYVLPVGKSMDYLVHVDAFDPEPGGIIETERLTTGHKVDDITLTVPDDPELSDELGLDAVRIDRVLYEAVSPSESEEVVK